MTEPLAYSVPQAAELVGISAWTYYEAFKKGQVPGRKIGRRIVVPRVALEAWLAGRDAA